MAKKELLIKEGQNIGKIKLIYFFFPSPEAETKKELILICLIFLEKNILYI
jgi:hypothetical protein